jgi:hypothetical protein
MNCEDFGFPILISDYRAFDVYFGQVEINFFVTSFCRYFNVYFGGDFLLWRSDGIRLTEVFTLFVRYCIYYYFSPAFLGQFSTELIDISTHDSVQNGAVRIEETVITISAFII